MTVLMQQADVRVIHGANDGLFGVAGKTVASVRRSLRTAFNIPDDAVALVNGVQVDGDHRLRPGTLEFVRLAGMKGGMDPEELARLAWLEERIATVEGRLVDEWGALAGSLSRIADHFDPPPPDTVDTAYVARRIGLGIARVAQMALRGEIPAHCTVPGTGNGKPWKFFRTRIDPWIDSR
jgi:hypothetical protein